MAILSIGESFEEFDKFIDEIWTVLGIPILNSIAWYLLFWNNLNTAVNDLITSLSGISVGFIQNLFDNFIIDSDIAFEAILYTLILSSIIVFAIDAMTRAIGGLVPLQLVRPANLIRDHQILKYWSERSATLLARDEVDDAILVECQTYLDQQEGLKHYKDSRKALENRIRKEKKYFLYSRAFSVLLFGYIILSFYTIESTSDAASGDNLEFIGYSFGGVLFKAFVIALIIYIFTRHQVKAFYEAYVNLLWLDLSTFASLRKIEISSNVAMASKSLEGVDPTTHSQESDYRHYPECVENTASLYRVLETSGWLRQCIKTIHCISKWFIKPFR